MKILNKKEIQDSEMNLFISVFDLIDLMNDNKYALSWQLRNHLQTLILQKSTTEVV